MVDFTRLIGQGNFYFLRHGESAGNAAHIAQGQADFPLTEKGKMQAVQVGRWLADKDIHLILSSPLLRASETAEIIAQEIGIAAQIRAHVTLGGVPRRSTTDYTDSPALRAGASDTDKKDKKISEISGQKSLQRRSPPTCRCAPQIREELIEVDINVIKLRVALERVPTIIHLLITSR